MKNKIGFVLLLGIYLACMLGGCTQTQSESEGIPVGNLVETTIPGINNFGATATYRENNFPRSLHCEDIELDAVKPGQTWRDIQIGVTNYEEMVTQLSANGGDVRIDWIEEVGHLSFENRAPAADQYWTFLDACFIGDVLVTLKIGGTVEEFPKFLPDTVKKFGKPDIVTWGFNYWHRTLIWLDLGILVEIDIELNESAGILLFPPIEAEEYNDSWLYKLLPKSIEGWEDPNLIDENGRYPPEYEKEDIWGLTSWWRK